MLENFKSLKFDMSKNLLTVFVTDGNKVRKIEIKEHTKDSGLPTKSWVDMVRGEVLFQQQKELKAAKGMLIPGYND